MRTQRACLAQLCQTLRSLAPGGLVVAMSLVASCIVKDGEECDKSQVRTSTASTDYCECAAGFVADTMKGYGCVAAPADAGGGLIDASTGSGDAAGGPVTGGCSTSSPCPQNQRCESGTCSDVTGLGKSCTSAAECAGSEASFCNTFLPAPSCMVADCAANTALCPTGYVCCAIAGMSSCGQGATCPPPTMMVP